jgi:mediator of RNA polymerase II transcription subunit 21
MTTNHLVLATRLPRRSKGTSLVCSRPLAEAHRLQRLRQDTVDTIAAADFKAGQIKLARHLVLKEQQIEYLISILPGLDNSERDQERTIKELEQELRVAEEERLEAAKEKDELLAKLDNVIRNTKRPW